jgi:inhibitor of KinA
MQLLPLGDQAILVKFPEESQAVLFAARIQNEAPDWLEDVVPAYNSVGVYFSAYATNLSQVRNWLQQLILQPQQQGQRPELKYEIPICYELQQDMQRIVEYTHLTFDEIIQLHLLQEYHVYAIGFVPGFPYMGYLPPALSGVSRLPSPRVRVEPGSVGITGRQTGIYPLPRPGGWNLIGRTPLTIVDLVDNFFPLRVGAAVRFRRIDECEFQKLLGERLSFSMSGSHPEIT